MSESKSKRFQYLIVGVAAALSLSAYIVYAGIFFRIGYPLDDAWIHQTYARNLAALGEWAFIPGMPSAGTTSPLWVTLLSIGYLFGINHFFWSFLIGWLLLWGLGVLSMQLFRFLIPGFSQYSIWVGVIITTEWHFIWAAGAGMETLLFSCLLMFLFVEIIHQNRMVERASMPTLRWGLLGGIAGGTIWVRPEGVISLGFLFLAAVLTGKKMREVLRHSAAAATGFLITSAPYLLFNFYLAGDIWPNTFYAKQAEYVELLSKPLASRILQEAGLFVVGVGAILLPGFLVITKRIFQERKWLHFIPMGWLLVHILMFSLRLPAVYQHGRYMMPVMPIYILYGFAGLVVWIASTRGKLWWILNRVWILSVACIQLAFAILGARSYAIGVAIIESEMVDTAHWISRNTDEAELIATHDIGAIGYFSQRSVLDLAGLISPDVVDFIRNQDELIEYINNSGAKYLATFPGTYPRLIKCGQLIFQTTSSFSPEAGGENMAVYQWEESDICVSDK